jgi:transcriptional regulator with XRE-family HTH domain
MPTYRLQADRLRQVAAERGDLTSYAIAKRTGLSQDTIGRLRKGKARPSARSLLVLAKTYGLTVEDLVEVETPVSA